MIVPSFLIKYSEWFEFDYQKVEYYPLEGAPNEALEIYNRYIETQKRMAEKGLR